MALSAGDRLGPYEILTDGGRAFVPVRKVFFCWYTWLNYIITDGDSRGLRAS